jgi:hypothetical protein
MPFQLAGCVYFGMHDDWRQPLRSRLRPRALKLRKLVHDVIGFTAIDIQKLLNEAVLRVQSGHLAAAHRQERVPAVPPTPMPSHGLTNQPHAIDASECSQIARRARDIRIDVGPSCR